MTVLILSRDLDVTTDAMIEALAERNVRAVRVNTAWFPTQLRITAELEQGHWAGKLRTPAHVLDLGEIQTVWYRSPEAFQLPADLPAPVRDHVFREAKHGFSVVSALDALWVDHPSRIADASFKPWQLARAQQHGLTVANTMITSEQESVRDFARRAPTITKQLSSNLMYSVDGIPQVLWTTEVTPGDLRDLHGVGLTTNLLQRRVFGNDVRVIVIGDRMWAFEILSPPGTLDYRRDYDGTQAQLVDLPPQLGEQVRTLMSSFDLLYGALDFLVTPDDEWTFLELNPGNGQYLWLEDATGAPLTDALADLLTGHTPPPQR